MIGLQHEDPETADPYERGLRRLATISGPACTQPTDMLDDMHPDLHRFVATFGFGPTHGQKARAAMNDGNGPRISLELPDDLDPRLDRTAIVAMVIQMAVSAGFPAALAGIAAAQATAGYAADRRGG